MREGNIVQIPKRVVVIYPRVFVIYGQMLYMVNGLTTTITNIFAQPLKLNITCLRKRFAAVPIGMPETTLFRFAIKKGWLTRLELATT